MRLHATAQITIPRALSNIAHKAPCKRTIVTHALTPHLQHEMSESDMMFGRVKHINRLLQLTLWERSTAEPLSEHFQPCLMLAESD